LIFIFSNFLSRPELDPGGIFSLKKKKKSHLQKVKPYKRRGTFHTSLIEREIGNLKKKKKCFGRLIDGR